MATLYDATIEQLSDKSARALLSLPDKYRKAFIAHHLHGQTYREYAEQNGLSEELAKGHVRSAKKILREKIPK